MGVLQLDTHMCIIQGSLSSYCTSPCVITLSSPEKLIQAPRAGGGACSLSSPGLGVYSYPNVASKAFLRGVRQNAAAGPTPAASPSSWASVSCPYPHT